MNVEGRLSHWGDEGWQQLLLLQTTRVGDLFHPHDNDGEKEQRGLVSALLFPFFLEHADERNPLVVLLLVPSLPPSTLHVLCSWIASMLVASSRQSALDSRTLNNNSSTRFFFASFYFIIQINNRNCLREYKNSWPRTISCYWCWKKKNRRFTLACTAAPSPRRQFFLSERPSYARSLARLRSQSARETWPSPPHHVHFLPAASGRPVSSFFKSQTADWITHNTSPQVSK